MSDEALESVKEPPTVSVAAGVKRAFQVSTFHIFGVILRPVCKVLKAPKSLGTNEGNLSPILPNDHCDYAALL